MNVPVPYLLQESTIEAQKILQSEGFQWKLNGNPAQHSIVENQSPEPGALVAKGSLINLYVVLPAAPGPRPIDDDDLPGIYGAGTVQGTRQP
jgi:hypothetical protein